MVAIMARFRPLALLTGVLSLISFVLILILTIAGSKKGLGEDFPIMTLNVSNVGQNLISITPVDSAAAATSASPTVTTASATTTSSSNPLNPLNLPTPTRQFHSRLLISQDANFYSDESFRQHFSKLYFLNTLLLSC